MGLLARLLGKAPGEPAMRTLWTGLVGLARDPDWYAVRGIADTKAGRFDALSLVMALALLRMEGRPALRVPSSRLTEQFIADIDGQLRQDGIGDPAIGKRIAALMAVLAGRIEALRAGLTASDPAVLEDAVRRNVTLVAGAGPALVAAALRRLSEQFGTLPDEELIAGHLAP